MEKGQEGRIRELIADLHRIIDPVGPTHAWCETLNNLERFAEAMPAPDKRAAQQRILEIEAVIKRWGFKPFLHGNCPLAFKGVECGYQGEALWCDKSRARCRELKNELRFGGSKR